MAERSLQKSLFRALTPIAVLMCVAGFSGTSPAKSSTLAKPNVILITVDTLRADHLGCYGNRKASTPVIDELAKQGFCFTQATAQVPLTLPSHYSILTGTFPSYHGVRDNSRGAPHGPPLVAEILRGGGYRTGAFVGSFMLDSRFGLNRGFDFYYDDFDISLADTPDLSHIERPAEQVIRRAIEWIAVAREPFFAWVHLFDPHDPYSPPEPFRSRFARSPYDGEIAYVDKSLGALIGSLKRGGLLERTHVILTSDHGEGLGDHLEPMHGLFVYESTIHVPLIVRTANGAHHGQTIHRVVQSVDIAPTILRLAGLNSGSEMQGHSLTELFDINDTPARGEAEGEAQAAYFETLYPLTQFGWSELRGIKMLRYKYIEAPRPELYDLQTDPSEKVNLYRSHAALAAQMKGRVDSHAAQYAQSPATEQSRPPDPETYQLLRSLGYVSGAANVPSSPSLSEHDPKDEINTYLKILKALGFANEGQPRAAAQLLEEVLGNAPEVTSARLILGAQYEKLGQLDKAVEQYQKALADDPGNALAAFNLAKVCSRQGQVHEATSWYRFTLKVDPTFSLADTALGIIYRNQGLWSLAIEEFHKALAFGPNYTARYNLAAIYMLNGQLDQALEQAREAVKLQPKHGEGYNILGSVYLMKNRMPEAEGSFRRVLELNPRSDTALTNLAEVFAKTGRVVEARESLQQALRINPKQEAARKLLAEMSAVN